MNEWHGNENNLTHISVQKSKTDGSQQVSCLIYTFKRKKMAGQEIEGSYLNKN